MTITLNKSKAAHIWYALAYLALERESEAVDALGYDKPDAKLSRKQAGHFRKLAKRFKKQRKANL